MKRSLLLLTVLALAGCPSKPHSEPASELAITVDRDASTPSGIEFVELDLADGTFITMVRPPIDFPISASAQLQQQGDAVVVATAYDGSHTAIAEGRSAVTLTRGQTTTVALLLGAIPIDTDLGPARDGGTDAPTQPPAITVDRTSFDFGALVITTSSAATVFTFTNPGSSSSGRLSTAIGGLGGAAFAIGADGCNDVVLAAGESCTVAVTFTPAAAGALAAQLSVVAEPGGSAVVKLAGTGLTPGALVGQAAVDFGARYSGEHSDDIAVAFTNSGGATTGPLATLLAGNNPDQFAITSDQCAGQSLAGGASCAISVRFAPTARGALAASLQVTGAPGGTASVALGGKGLFHAALSASPSTAEVGWVQVGDSGSVSISITNAADDYSGTIDVTIGGPDAALFSISDGWSAPCRGRFLFGDASCSFSVVYQPLVETTSVQATVTVTATPGGTLTLPVHATAVALHDLVVSPTSSFISHGEESAAQTVTVTNVTSLPAGPLTASLSSTEFVFVSDGCSGQTLASGASCTMHIALEPTGTGTPVATLSVGGHLEHDFSDGITLHGYATFPLLSVTPDRFSFGAIAVGQKSATASFTVKDISPNVTASSSVYLFGGDASDFVLDGDGCDIAVAPGNSCGVRASFAPRSAGAKATTLVVRDPIAEYSVGVALSGTAE
jgi:hypothetical protein